MIACWLTIVIVVWINMHMPSMLSHALLNPLWLFVLTIMKLHPVLSINCHVFHHYLDVFKIVLSFHFLWLFLTVNIYFNMLNHNYHISKDWPNFTFQWTYHPYVFYLTTTAIVCTSCFFNTWDVPLIYANTLHVFLYRPCVCFISMHVPLLYVKIFVELRFKSVPIEWFPL